jgi:hypothetical protein
MVRGYDFIPVVSELSGQLLNSMLVLFHVCELWPPMGYLLKALNCCKAWFIGGLDRLQMWKTCAGAGGILVSLETSIDHRSFIKFNLCHELAGS